MRRTHANLLLLTAGAVWGMGFVAQSTAMAAVGPWTYTTAKFGLAALTVLPFALFERGRATKRTNARERGGFVWIGMLLFTAAILQQLGIQYTSVTNAGFLTGLYVVLTPALALLLFAARPHPVVWPASLAAFAGIVLIGGGRIGAMTGGDLLVIASAVFWALQILFVGRFAGSAGRPFALSFAQFTVTAGVAALGALVLEVPSSAAILSAAPEILYGGILSTGLAFTLQVMAQRHTSPAQAAIFLSSEALFAGLFGAVLLGERLPAAGLAGCALLFLAMLAVEIVPARRSQAPGHAPS